jgi:hypothetical protein
MKKGVVAYTVVTYGRGGGLGEGWISMFLIDDIFKRKNSDSGYSQSDNYYPF